MKGLHRLGLVAVLASAGGLQAQTPPDSALEIIGLHRWTPQMVADSFRRYAPGETLWSGGCAIILRDSMGFAQAAVETTYYGQRVSRTISLVERQDAGRVRFNAIPSDSLAVRPEWAEAVALLRKSPRAMGPLQRWEFLSGHTDESWDGPAKADEIRLRDLVRAAAVGGLREAAWTFEHDKNPYNQLMAGWVLALHADEDQAWLTVIRGLRARPQFPTSTSVTLATMTNGASRVVNWRPAQEDLRALLAGTNLFAFLDVVAALTATQVDPALGLQLARAEPDLLLANLQSMNPRRREIVRRFLLRLAGKDLGLEASPWADWLRART